MALFSVAALAMAVGTALVVSSADVLATRNYTTGAQVHLAAESAIAEALQTVNGPGVVDFRRDVVRRWRALWGPGPRRFAAAADFAYTVSAEVEPGDPSDGGRFVATATGPEGARRVVAATVVRVALPATSPGALLLTAAPPARTHLGRGRFSIDGNDHDLEGRPAPGPPVLGIATRTAEAAERATAGLDAAGLAAIRGVGYAPRAASASSSPAAPSARHLDRILETLRARRGVVTERRSRFQGNVSFGSRGAPAITELANDDGVTLRGGRVSGAGILIVAGDLTVAGTLTFDGLVIVEGLTTVEGDATVQGSLWTGDLRLARGTVTVRYSSAGLGLAGAVAAGSALPAPVVVTSLVDCPQIALRARVCR
jgi:hypothetical protein